MFVSSSRYKALEGLFRQQVAANQHLVTRAATAERKYMELLVKWNTLVDRVNAWGDLGVFDQRPAETPLTKKEIRSLLQLCHPDKHGGKESAIEVTQKLTKMLDKAT